MDTGSVTTMRRAEVNSEPGNVLNAVPQGLCSCGLYGDDRSLAGLTHDDLKVTTWRVPDIESTRFWSRVGVIQIQLMLQATGVWMHLQTAAYSAGVR